MINKKYTTQRHSLVKITWRHKSYLSEIDEHRINAITSDNLNAYNRVTDIKVFFEEDLNQEQIKTLAIQELANQKNNQIEVIQADITLTLF